MAEGNFYVSNTVMKKPLRSSLGAAYLDCRGEAREYAKCVEKYHANKEMKKDVCLEERTLLDQCVDKKRKSQWAEEPGSISSGAVKVGHALKDVLEKGGSRRIIR